MFYFLHLKNGDDNSTFLTVPLPLSDWCMLVTRGIKNDFQVSDKDTWVYTVSSIEIRTAGITEDKKGWS